VVLPCGARSLCRLASASCSAYARFVGDFSRDEAKQRIHAAGLRATAPRVAVLRLLSGARRPLSHAEVVEAVGDDDWDQATVYRNLLKLVEVDLARVASRADGVSRYEMRGDGSNLHLHPHFSCRTCGIVECLPEAKLAGSVARRWNRSLENSELQLIGDCPDCLGAHPRSRASKGTRRKS
jgi:Fur family ferric uptake transcriptional regulator